MRGRKGKVSWREGKKKEREREESKKRKKRSSENR